MKYLFDKRQSLPAIGLGTYNLKYTDFLNLLPECLNNGVVFLIWLKSMIMKWILEEF